MDQATISFEAAKLAFTLAKDLSAQLLTLSTALVGVAVIFSKDIKKNHSFREALLVLAILLAYTTSILAGIFTMMKLTGALAPSSGKPEFSLDGARLSSQWQILSFLFATILFVVHGISAAFELMRRPKT
jgi:membrane-bound metal-dependent hydrolase YbcI (DUF457 family)